jgi:hypothetical protein
VTHLCFSLTGKSFSKVGIFSHSKIFVFFVGNPFFDFCRFLVISGDAEVRREIQEHLVEDFYAMLKREYKEQSNGRVNLNFTLEQVTHFKFIKINCNF